jgi:hypothetical protein
MITTTDEASGTTKDSAQGTIECKQKHAKAFFSKRALSAMKS